MHTPHFLKCKGSMPAADAADVSLLHLRCRFPSLKVAYLDVGQVPGRDAAGPTQFSVLARTRRAADPVLDPTQPMSAIAEAYRIRLPLNRYSARGVVLGEGKPENQNHAAVFAFGEGLQAIDMNQARVQLQVAHMHGYGVVVPA